MAAGRRLYPRGCSHLNQDLGCATDPPRERLSAQDVEDFFTAYPGYCRNRGPLAGHLRQARYSIDRLIAFLCDSMRRGKPRSTSPCWMPTWPGWARSGTPHSARWSYAAIRLPSSFAGWVPRLPRKGCHRSEPSRSSASFSPIPRAKDKPLGAPCKRRCVPFSASASSKAGSTAAWIGRCRHYAPTNYPPYPRRAARLRDPAAALPLRRACRSGACPASGRH